MKKSKKEKIKYVPRAAKIILGFIFIIAGLIGILLPFVPGTLLIIIGFLLLLNKNVKKTTLKIIKSIKKKLK